MLIHITAILTPDQLRHCRERLAVANWADGRHSAGYLSQAVKYNSQLADTDPVALELGDLIISALEKNALFTSAALPLKVLPPLFNRYSENQYYGWHIDGAIRPFLGSHHRLRTDLSATLFLNEPDSYIGGELIIRDIWAERRVKLAAGDMVLYSGNTVHRVEPVSRGERLAAFFWIQSMVRDSMSRRLLFDLDSAIQRLASDVPQHPALVELAAVYHNLLRMWSDS